jgi:hypothetical protein
MLDGAHRVTLQIQQPLCGTHYDYLTINIWKPLNITLNVLITLSVSLSGMISCTL